MIVDMPDTTTSAVSRKLVQIRESGGAVALGRVLTLILVTDDGPAEDAIRAANEASREHPCRVIAIVRGNRRGSSRLDAQVRVGGDAGASEVLVLRLWGPLADHGDSVVVPFLLPDAPIVAWWPGVGPEVPGQDPIGRMAQRRILDAAATPNPMRTLKQRASNFSIGDTDLAWSRITLWRGLLAAALDQPPYEPVDRADVTGGADSPSADLLAAWLALYLECPVGRTKTANGTGLVSVTLQRSSGPIELIRPEGAVATLSQAGQPDRRISLAPRADKDCLAEELRRLDPDEVLEDVIRKGMPLLGRGSGARSATKTRSGVRPVRREPEDRASGNGGAGEDGELPDPLGTGRQVVSSTGGVTDTPLGGAPGQAES